MSCLLERLDDLIQACTEGSVDRVQSLIEEGNDVNMIQKLPGSCYQTPLLEACRFNHPHLLEMLLKHGAKPDLQLPDNEESKSSDCCPVAMAIMKFQCRTEECSKLLGVKLLHRNGTSLTKEYSGTGSLMHLVARSGCHHVAEWLTEQGSDIDTPYRNQTALQIAVSSANTKIAARLIQANACPSEQLKVLGLAGIRGNIDVVRMLLEAGVMYRLHSESNSVKVLFSRNSLSVSHEGIAQILQEAKLKVLSLQHICRIIVRNSLGTCSKHKLDLLPIPSVHKDFLRLTDLDNIA